MTSWGQNAGLPHGFLRIGVTLISQDTVNNTSTINVASGIYADAGWGPSNSSGVGCSLSGPGVNESTAFNLSVPQGGSQAVMSRNITLSHNADGTRKGVTYTASIGDTGTSVFGAGTTVSVTFDLPAIARASQPTVSASAADAGTVVTIQTHRASTSFTHDLTYKLGTASGTITTGLPTDYNWTIPMGILAGIPDNTSGTCTITCVTKSGSTVIGTRTVTFTVRAPATVVPTLAGITCTEAVSAVATAIGAFVQKNSKLTLGITGAAGAYGSTISSYKITVDGQTITAVSGTTGLIQSAGTLTIAATVTDSRGRTGTASTTITVLPYSPPTIDTGATGIVRCTSAGVLDVFNGTYLKPTLKVSVQSLKPGATEKNSITYRVSTRNHATGGAYTQKATASPAGVAFTGTLAQFGTYDISSSWDVLIEVSDKFATTQYLLVVPTGAAILHLHTGGVGILKRHEQGALDVGGDIYTNGGLVLLPGEIRMYAGASAPTGWLLCQGQAVSRTTYAKLFAAIGTSYGAGDGSTTFNLPNFKGRAPVGVDSSQTEFNAPGAAGGEKAHKLTTAEMPSHNHQFSYANGGYDSWPLASSTYPGAGNVAFTQANAGANRIGIAASGGDGAHNNLQPYLTVNFLIKT